MAKKPLTKEQLSKRIDSRKAEITKLRLKIARLHRDNAADYARKLEAMNAANVVKRVIDRVTNK